MFCPVCQMQRIFFNRCIVAKFKDFKWCRNFVPPNILVCILSAECTCFERIDMIIAVSRRFRDKHSQQFFGFRTRFLYVNNFKLVCWEDNELLDQLATKRNVSLQRCVVTFNLVKIEKQLVGYFNNLRIQRQKACSCSNTYLVCPGHTKLARNFA